MAEVEIKTLRFHVTCVYPNKPEDERKKILKLDDPRCYKERIISLFSLRADGDYKILSYVEEFDDWVDIDDWSELPDTRGKLKIIVRTGRLLWFNFYRAMHYSAKRGIAIARLSVCDVGGS